MTVSSKGIESVNSLYWLTELTNVIYTDSGRKVTKVFDRILSQIVNNKQEVRKLVRTTVSLCFVNDKRNFAVGYLISFQYCFTDNEIEAYIKDWKANKI